MGRTAGLVSLLACFLLTGCFLVPESRYKTALAERDDCQSEVKLLRDANVSLAAKIENLERKTDSLETKLLNVKVEKKVEVERVSQSYENLVKELKDEIARGEISINEMKGRLTVNMLDKVLFDLGKAEVKPTGKQILDRIGPVIKDAKDRDIRIEGHTDSLSIFGDLAKKYPTNWELSTARATNVVRYLQESAGIEPGRLVAAGYSWYRPVASNATPEGRQQNRRIEIVLVPKGT
jgi:chemotaxis protein MotB